MKAYAYLIWRMYRWFYMMGMVQVHSTSLNAAVKLMVAPTIMCLFLPIAKLAVHMKFELDSPITLGLLVLCAFLGVWLPLLTVSSSKWDVYVRGFDEQTAWVRRLGDVTAFGLLVGTPLSYFAI